MFSPDGFTSAFHLRQKLYDFGVSRMPFAVLAEQAADSESELTFTHLYHMRSIFPSWAMQRILITQPIPVYLSSPTGMTVKATPMMFAGRLDMAFDEFSVPNLTEDQVNLALKREATESQDPWDENDNLYVSSGNWCVKSREEMMRTSQIWISGFTDEHTDKDLLARLMASEDAMMTVAAQFSGWAICFRDSDLPRDEKSLEALTSKLGASFSLPIPSVPIPKLKGSAADALREMFPAGRKGTPWKVVAAMVEERIGRTVSTKTCMRAASEIGQDWTNR